MGADDHGLWTSVDIRAEAGQRVARERSGSLAVGEDARCDDNGQVEAAAAGSPVWRWRSQVVGCGGLWWAAGGGGVPSVL